MVNSDRDEIGGNTNIISQMILLNHTTLKSIYEMSLVLLRLWYI
jgi:hypothetical protein